MIVVAPESTSPSTTCPLIFTLALGEVRFGLLELVSQESDGSMLNIVSACSSCDHSLLSEAYSSGSATEVAALASPLLSFRINSLFTLSFSFDFGRLHALA